jgi:hypothetical protein
VKDPSSTNPLSRACHSFIVETCHFFLQCGDGTADAQNHQQPYLITDILSPSRVFGPLSVQELPEHSGGAIGLSTRLCSLSAVSSSCLVAACEPFAWRGICEMARFLIRTRPEAQPAIPITGCSFSTQGFVGRASMGPREWVNIYNFSSRSFKQCFQAVRPSSFVSFISCISQSRCLLSSRDAFVNHCYTTPQPRR